MAADKGRGLICFNMFVVCLGGGGHVRFRKFTSHLSPEIHPELPPHRGRSQSQG